MGLIKAFKLTIWRIKREKVRKQMISDLVEKYRKLELTDLGNEIDVSILSIEDLKDAYETIHKEFVKTLYYSYDKDLKDHYDYVYHMTTDTMDVVFKNLNFVRREINGLMIKHEKPDEGMITLVASVKVSASEMIESIQDFVTATVEYLDTLT